MKTNLFTLLDKWNNVLFSGYNALAQVKYFLNYHQIQSIIGENKKFKGIHTKEKCFIVLNGPSLKNNDVSVLKDEYVFCVNYMYKSDIVDVISPQYYCWMDSQIFSKPEKGRETIRDLQMKCPEAELFMNYKAYYVVERNEKTHFTYNMHMPSSRGGKYSISGLSSGYINVLGYAIGIAIFMGFGEIYILGLDFEPTGFKHFEDAVGGPGQQEARNYDSLTHYGGILKAHCEFAGSATYARKHGICIRNLNPDSYVRAFDFSTMKEVLKKE